jgi:hypothetical protein
LQNDESSGREDEVEDAGQENLEVVRREESSNGVREDFKEAEGAGQDDDRVGVTCIN